MSSVFHKGVFCVLNFAALKGFLNFLTGSHSVKWDKASKIKSQCHRVTKSHARRGVTIR